MSDVIDAVFAESKLIEEVHARTKTGCTCHEIMARDQTRHFRGCLGREEHPTHAAEGRVIEFPTASDNIEFPAASDRLKDATLAGFGREDLIRVIRVLENGRDEALKVGAIYRDTLTTAQGSGTRLHNDLVRARNLLRCAQPYLELHEDHQQCEGDPELLALCDEVAKEVGPVDPEEDGAAICKRLGIDTVKWAAELRAKMEAYSSADKRKMVCLCGSTSFSEAYAAANLEETLKGHVVLSVGSMTHSDSDLKITAEQKIALDALHKDKIVMADEVLVLNCLRCTRCSYIKPTGEQKKGAGVITADGRAGCGTIGIPPCNFEPYIGPSTKSEIEHALRLGKTIRFLNAQGVAWIEGINRTESGAQSDEDVAKMMKFLGLAP